MHRSKTSEYAGRLASVFSVFGFAAMVAFQNASESPLLAIALTAMLMLAAVSGTVCLVAAFFGWRRQQR